MREILAVIFRGLCQGHGLLRETWSNADGPLSSMSEVLQCLIGRIMFPLLGMWMVNAHFSERTQRFEHVICGALSKESGLPGPVSGYMSLLPSGALSSCFWVRVPL